MPKTDQPADPALAAVLRQLREARGESLESLAFRSGLTSSALGRIELGQASPAWATVRSILSALEVTLAKLAREVEAHETAG